MKRSFISVTILLVILTGISFAGDGKTLAITFALTAIGNNPTAISFRLTSPPAEPASSAIIEDPNRRNTAIGWNALSLNAGYGNTAAGYMALWVANSDSGANTAIGEYALRNNTSGQQNTAIGAGALSLNTTGRINTAVGNDVLGQNTTGLYNTAIGSWALSENVSGHNNVASGMEALNRNQTGSFNTALGFQAGYWCSGGAHNIYLGAGVLGDSADAHTIRIGKPYGSDVEGFFGQNQTYVAGIVETALDASATPAVVGITPEGRLGTMSEDLLPMGPQGPPGPPGEGLVEGSLLFLPAGFAPPPGYALIGSSDFKLNGAGNKPLKLVVNVYQKNSSKAAKGPLRSASKAQNQPQQIRK